MQRIRDVFLNCVFYVYSSSQDAESGVHAGGSGFLAHAPLEENPERCIIYAVTNSHVIKKCGDRPSITVNTVDGKREVFETANLDWEFLPNHDVAIVPVNLDSATHKISHIPIENFITPELIEKQEIGPGDETFMIGRFINHEGKEKNLPAARFGNISMMPYEPIIDEYGVGQESFLVECRSIPGYSGSPVFLNIDFAIPRPSEAKAGKSFFPGRGIQQRLLGIDWAHINNYDPVFEKTNDVPPLVKTNLVTQSNTSMAAVVPAWRIGELLNLPKFKEMRTEIDKNLTARKAELAASSDSADNTQPFTKSDFEQALRKASRRIQPSGSGSKKK